MKKLFTLTAAFAIAASVSAQEVTPTEPLFLDDFCEDFVFATGVSPDGRFVYGVTPGGAASFYDFNSNTPYFSIKAGPEDKLGLGLSIAGITTEGKALISDYMHSYTIDLNNDNKKVFIESPDSQMGVNAWDISSDGSIIGCNLASETFQVKPMVGIRQADGSYKLEYLEYEDLDAMGCQAQFTQVRQVSDDGKFLIGMQQDERGMYGRLVVWTRQDDGTYKYSTPMDNFIYDFSYEKPGTNPEEGDIITADPETDPELYNQQLDEFFRLYDEWEQGYRNFTRNGSSLNVFGFNKGTRSNLICLSFKDNRDGNLKEIPVFYDCDEDKIYEYPEIGKAFGCETLPGGGQIIATRAADLCGLIAADKDGNIKPFEEWFKEMTGFDLAKDYFYEFYSPMEDINYSGIYPGVPHFSNDGKTLVFSGMNPENADNLTSVIKFDKDIFAAVSTGIKVNVVNKVIVNGGRLNIGADKHGVADVYTMNGAKCGSYHVNGTINLNETLAHGAYIVKVSVEGEEPVSMKMIIR